MVLITLFTLLIDAMVIFYCQTLLENPHWFTTKTYGYGLRPVTWQGWAATVGLVALIVFDAQLLSRPVQTGIALVLFFFLLACNVGTMLYLSCKTGDKMRWRWGK